MGAAVFFLALAVRLSRLSTLTCPLPVDAAYYYSVAENLHHGRGFVIDYTWNYLRGLPQGLPVPSNDYWQPLVSIILALAFLVAPVSWVTAQVVASFFGCLVALLAFWFAWKICRDSLLALLAGVFVAVLPQAVFVSYTTDTSVFFAVFGGGALISLVLALRESPRWLLGVGIFSALAYLTRSDGALILLTATLMLLWFRKRPTASAVASVASASPAGDPQPTDASDTAQQSAAPSTGRVGAEAPDGGWLTRFWWQWALAMWGIFLLLVSPWLVRNYFAFGSPLAGGFLKAIFVAKYADLFTSQPENLTLANYLAHGLIYNLSLKVMTLGNCPLELRDIYGWPILVLAIWELCAGRREASHLPVLFHFVLILYAAAFFLTMVALRGTFDHMAPVFLPLLPAYAALGVGRFWRKVRLARFLDFRWPAALFLLGFSVYSAASLSGHPSVHPGLCERKLQLERNTLAFLQEKGLGERPVFTDNPWNYYYVNGRPAYFTPIDPYARIKEVAQRLRVDYMVLSPGVSPRLPDFDDMAEKDTNLLLLGFVYPFKEIPNTEVASHLSATERQERWSVIEDELRRTGTPLYRVETVMVFRFLDPAITGRPLSPREVGRLQHRSGRELATVGQYEQAVIAFRKAVQCAPDEPATYYNLARALYDYASEIEAEGSGHTEAASKLREALRNAETACRMDPKNEGFARLLADIRARLRHPNNRAAPSAA